MHILSTFDVITLLSTTHSSSLRRFPVPLVTTGILYICIYTLEESPPFGIALVPDFANLGSILVLFWHPFATLGANLGTILVSI